MSKLLLENFLGGKAGSQYLGQQNSYYDAEGLTATQDLGLIKPGWKLNAISNSGSNAELDRIVGFAVYSVTPIAYAIGDNGKLHKITNIEVSPTLTNDATWSQSISAHGGHATPTGKDVVIYHEATADLDRLFYSWNDNTDGDIGRMIISSEAKTDNYFSTLGSGFALNKVAHPLFVWKNDNRLYCGDGSRIAILNDTTPSSNTTVIPAGWEITSFFDAGNYLGITAWFIGREASFNQTAIFYWDGVSAQASNSIMVEDNKITTAVIKNNVPCIFTGRRGFSSYLRSIDENGQDLPILELRDDSDTAFNSPDSPNQVTTRGGFIVWCDGGRIHTYGTPKRGILNYWEMPTAQITQDEEGAIKAVGGNILLYSYANSGTDYLAYFDAGQFHTSGGSLKTLYYTFPQRIKINYIRLNLMENLESGEDIDVNLQWFDIDSNSLTEIGDFNFTNDGAKSSKTFRLTPHNSYCHSFRLVIDWNSNTTAALRSIVVDWDYVPDLLK